MLHWDLSQLSCFGFQSLAHCPSAHSALGEALWKELAGACELGLWPGLLGILISDVIFKRSLKVELISL